MKQILLTILIFLFVQTTFSQSETNNFTTYDTVLVQGAERWAIRISRPVNMFTPNHPDTASRPAIIMMPGSGEAVNNLSQQQANAKKYGPHYWLDNGWDGGITTANGKHYPILITVVPSYQNPRAPAFTALLNHLLNTYRIKRNSVHGTGLSMGAFTWSKCIAYEVSAGDETFMKMVKSITLLQGASNETFAPYSAWSLGWGAFGRWANKYDGRFFGLEGTNDSRAVWQPRNNIRDSLTAAGKTNTAYFAFENLNNGAHCCYNEMYDPSKRNWKNTRLDMGTNIAWNAMAGRDNSMGNYKNGWNIFEWMFRQGDTTLVTSGPSLPIANAGPDQNITSTSVTLNSSSSTGTITSRTWSRLSGPNTPTIVSPNSASTNVTGLVNGTYNFRITLSDGTNTSTDDVQVIKSDPANIPPVVNAGVDKIVTLPTSSVEMTATATDADGTVTVSWSQFSGPNTATIVSPSSVTTTISGLVVGVYGFRITGTDNSGAVVSDDLYVTVQDPAIAEGKRIYFSFYFPNFGTAYDEATYNNLRSNGNNNYTSTLNYEDGKISPYIINATNFHQFSNNGSTYTGFTMCPDAVGQQTSYFAGTRTIQFSGLNNATAYNLTFFSSRINVSHSTRFIVGSTEITIASGNNKDQAAIFNEVYPTSGIITVTVVGLSIGYVNGGILEEAGAAQTVNTPPVVSVINNQTITLPTNSVSLTSSVTDNGAVTYLWSKITGPANGVITTPTQASTTFTSLTQGIYNMQFSATDEEGLTTSRAFTITVNAAGNQLPVVNGGGNQNLVLPAQASTINTNVTGTAVDNDGVIVSVQWKKISGGNFTIVNPNAYTTQLIGLAPDTYVLEFIATDNNGGQSSSNVTIQVTIPFIDDLPSTIVGVGEYQAYFIDSARHLWGIGNKTNAGSNNTGPDGVPARAFGDAHDVRFKYVAGGLKGGGAIDVDGNLWTTGDNNQAQMGIGSFEHPIYTWRKILTDSLGNPFTNVKTVTGAYLWATQSNYFVALKEDGTAWIWGKVLGGTMGNNTDSVITYITKPYQLSLPGGRSFKQITAGVTIIALATDNTVWTWGRVQNYANLGYVGSGYDYRSPKQVTGLPSNIREVIGGGSFNYAVTTDGQLYGWGLGGNFMGDLVHPTGTGIQYPTPRLLTNIMNNLPSPIKKITLNYAATHVVLENGDLYGWGDNAQSGVGNGKSLHWPSYGWAWPGTAGMLFEKLPVQIVPGIKFSQVYSGNAYVYYSFALATDGQLYCWARNKAAVLPTRTIIASSQLNANKQNLADQKWPVPVNPFNFSTAYLATSPDCVDGTSTGSPCNTYSIPANTKPVANAGPNQNITTSHTVLNGSASSDNVSIGWWEWTQKSGPSTAIISLPGYHTTPVSGLVDGTYEFQILAQDNGRLKDSATVIIVVGQKGDPAINLPPVVATASPINLIKRESVTLVASATDPEGQQLTYNWEQISGPSTVTIINPNQAITLVDGFANKGSYTMRLTVTDNEGLSTSVMVLIHRKDAENQVNKFGRKL